MNNRIIITWRRFHNKYLQELKLKYATWLSNRYPSKYCWADCVAWSYSSSRINPFKIDSPDSCKTESIEHNCKTCYCGGWIDGKCYSLLTDKEKQQMKAERDAEYELNKNEIPF